ncbi:LacI family transcriptional regulator [Cypionkella aquatica]|uniref:LacI family transcriptional regulator n=1 Tax=Cypionkella aquatica TaxID=1756042 RepID=A0AA37U1B8_9RHOB|nr:LacI family DNA-binding transcriptional regulator [Cypionkella aquatica]GLS85840.1 LacI family transcriptional regulator [Cypionkella aquatica]
MTKRPTITDLAEASGVSVATVDRVLNGRKTVREGTALRVLEAARSIGFHAAPLLQKRILDDVPTFKIGLLLLQESDFYLNFKTMAEALALEERRMNIRLTVAFLPSSQPADIVLAVEKMAERVQAIGLVSIDHPRVTEVVESVKQRGIPVFALLSDFAQGVRESYIGPNNLKVGRTAGWMISRGLQGRQGEIALFVGGHRWHGHELRETGFRAYFRENRPDLTLLETQVNLDTAKLSYEATLSLLKRHPTLAGIYCAGGGREGIIDAIRDEGRVGSVEIVANELTDFSRRAMADGVLSLVIDTPIRAICTELFDLALRAVTRGPGQSSGQVFLPMNLVLPESI